MSRTVMLVAVSTIISAALAAASPAWAAAPVHEWVSLDESFTHDSCGFTVEESFAGTLHMISWFDDTGTRTRKLVAAPNFRVTTLEGATGAFACIGRKPATDVRCTERPPHRPRLALST